MPLFLLTPGPHNRRPPLLSPALEKGYTFRSSTHCLLAAITIQNDAPVWHKNRDFAVTARFTRLRVSHPPGLPCFKPGSFHAPPASATIETNHVANRASFAG